ncbi:MAG: cytochrome c biogenesis protein ResB [Actinomycetaceae bacterium]|nr:cytochrome c biogenesis protein ResB [Actinomycetaceae bacterium]
MSDRAAATPNKSTNTPAERRPITVAAVFRQVYRLLYSKLLGVLVILAMAVVSFLGTLIMQAPMSKATDPAGYAQWLDVARSKYGGWTPVFDALGFFSMWTSPLFLGITVLLGMSIIACTTHRLPLLIDKTLRPRTHVSDRFFSHAQYRAAVPTTTGTADALEITRQKLRKQHYRVVADEKAPDTSIYADRFRFGPFGTVIAHASFVIILAAFAISAFTGFEESIEAPVGTPIDIGHDTGLTLEATSFEDSYDDQGRPIDYVSHVKLSSDSGLIKEQDVRVNTPLVYEGVRIHQASFGIAATVLIETMSGDEVVNAAVPLKWTSDDGLNSIGRVDVPDIDRQFIVVTPASGQNLSTIEPGTVLIEIYQLSNGNRLDAGTVTQGDTEIIGDFTATFEREQQYAGLIVRKDPGTIWMWIGSLLLIIGMTMTFGFRHRRIWARVSAREGGSTIHLASVEKHDSIFERQFRDLATSLSEYPADDVVHADSAPTGNTDAGTTERKPHA